MANQYITSLEQQADGSFKEVISSKKISFTPSTANRWYRVLQSDTIIAGEIRIIADHPLRKTDLKVDVSVGPNSRGCITQTSNLVIPPISQGETGGHISFVRVARNQNSQVVVDILCTTADQEITVEGKGISLPDFNTEPPIIGNGNDEYNGIIGGDGDSLANTLRMSEGLNTNLRVVSYHGHRDDPGQPLSISGRAAYLHGLALIGGAGKFTSATDHFHLTMRGGTAASAGFWTPQHFTTWNTFDGTGRQRWSEWQYQNANNTDSNEIFLGGIYQIFFGSVQIQNPKYGIDTRRIETTGIGDPGQTPVGNRKPGPPLWQAEVDLFFNSPPSVVNGELITLQFPVGEAGISAAILTGEVLGDVQGPLTAPDGAADKFKVVIMLNGLTKEEWPTPSLARFSTAPNQWILSKTINPILPDNQVSLEVHPTRRDKLIATYNQPHNLQLGQNIVLYTIRNWQTPPALRSGYVSKVLSLTSVDIEMGVCRRTGNLRYGNINFTHHLSNSTSSGLGTILQSPNHNVPQNTFLRCRLSSMGVLPAGLQENRDYWFRSNPVNAPTTWFNLFNSLEDAQSGVNAVQVNYGIPSYGLHYLTFMDLDPIGAEGWTLYPGNIDVVHQQTPADVGWSLHRNIFPNNRSIAQGVITQGTFGGLCNANTEYQPAFAFGFDVSSEADYTTTLGQRLINDTPRTTLVGFEDTTLAFQSDNALLKSTTTEISGSQINLNVDTLTVTSAMLSTNGVDTYLKIKGPNNENYGLKLELLS
jgi:hypothetical protein